MIFRGKRGKRGEETKVGYERRTVKRMGAALTALSVAFTMLFTSSLAFASTSVSPFTATAYTHNSSFDDRLIVNGMDVSEYQQSIDWPAAKAAGIDFAIIRIGYRGYGAAGNMKPDSCFVKHIEGAKEAGVRVGVYFFSQALNTFEAEAEARYTLELLGDYELDLPIFMDYEFSPASSGRFTSGTITKLKATENVEAFCDYIEAKGYEAGLYANLNFLNKTVDGESLGEKYPVWVAQYYTSCNYDYTYDYWQYSSSGSVTGISGRADVNFLYLKREDTKTSELSMTDAVVYLNTYTNYTYSPGVKYEPSVSVYHDGNLLTEGVDYELSYIGNAAAGTAYAMVTGKGAYTDYKLTSFTINPSSSLSGITVKKPADRKYTGSVTKPSYITVTDALGNKLIENLDYTYRVENAVNVGEADLYVDFMGNYSGSKSVKYNIVKATQTISLGDARTSTKLSEGAYDLKVSLKQSGATLTYSSSNTAVASVSSAGVVTPKAAGTLTITVKAAATSEYGAAEKTITLTVIDDTPQQPEEPLEPSDPTDKDSDAADNAAAEKNERIKAGVQNTKVVSLKAAEVGRKRVKLTWKKSNSGYRLDTYQIWRSTKKSSGYSKIFTSSNATNKYYINTKGLEPNKTYWYKVRGVRTVDGKKVYTPFTKLQVKTAK